MAPPAATPPAEGGSAPLRWSIAVALALGLHAGAAALLIRGARPEPLDAGGGDAIAVELDPVEGEAAKPDERQPTVPADEPAAASAAAAAAQASPPPPDLPAPVAPPVEQPPPPAVPPPEAPPEALPDVPTPPPPPRPEPPRPEAPPVTATQPSAASAAAEDAARAVQKLSAAREAAWRGKLVPHLNRFRRPLPGGAGGTARIGFTLDAEGRVTAVSVATGSGSAALDEAARELIRRASPFPPPPPGVDGAALSFVVPVHYDARRP